MKKQKITIIMPAYKFIGNRFLTIFENLLLGTYFSEFHTGYRLYNCNNLKRIPFLKCSNNFYFSIIKIQTSKVTY